MSVDAARPLVCRYAGPRIRLVDGHAHLLPAVPAPTGMICGRFSVLSPGTERRHLYATTGFDGPRHAGYMTFGGDHSAGWVLAAVPHGACFDPSTGGTITAPPGTRIQAAAVARFQQMAVLGLDQVPAGVSLDDAVVVGSGPVALGCALELRRRGAARIQVLTGRRQPPISYAPGVECASVISRGRTALVIDAAGTPRRAARLLTPRGTLGLLGTPALGGRLSSLLIHRSGWTVVGMHELSAAATRRYQDAYTAAATWLNGLPPDLVDSWCHLVPGTQAPALYAGLDGPRSPEPVVIFSWEVS
ncbi:hypothetical protein SAMN05216275_119100 [Streptosporangium canum]|uniref:Threonine dehydrogenase n=1 Tax=Streptosporangium canum TaxID=324952 RepID=A0A1I3XKJ5_9ACTN|nr:hypothetical protein [Streptosporangium canum]SFK20063.1 hypothetical protein SAMN05216275_119100 [Streptosporangium canum]